MGRVIAGMTMSLDGYVNDAAGQVDRLYPDFETFRDSPAMTAAIAATGAVIMGRRTFAMGDPDAYDQHYEFQVPIFVLTHHPPATPPKQSGSLTFTFLDGDIAAAVARARAAAGERDVQIVGGADVIRQALTAGLVDELNLDVMPVILGGGLRLFDEIDPARVALETIGVETFCARISLRMRVRR